MESLKDYIYTMESCNSCGQCRFILGPKGRGWDNVEICPIFSRYLFEAYSGQGLINLAQELLEGSLKYDEGLLKHIYSCTTCGACDVNCKSIRDMEVMDTILALREKCVEDGQGPMPEHKNFSSMVKLQHNIYGNEHSRRFEWLPDDIKITEEADTAYFVGCTTAYRQPQIARNTVKILQACGIPFKMLNNDEFCCGAPLWRTGQTAEARELAEHNLEAMKNSGIKTLIVSCAECYGTFKGFYPRIREFDIKVLHISEVLQKVLGEGRLKLSKGINLKATYHDPCLLGRLSEQYIPWKGEIQAYGLHVPPKTFRRGTFGIYDAPRKVIQAIPGLELVEMVRNAENSFCCGGGGGVPAAFPEFSQWTASQRLNEVISTGAEAVISCCPFCGDNLKQAISQNNSGVRYYDITELIAEAI